MKTLVCQHSMYLCLVSAMLSPPHPPKNSKSSFLLSALELCAQFLSVFVVFISDWVSFRNFVVQCRDGKIISLYLSKFLAETLVIKDILTREKQAEVY